MAKGTAVLMTPCRIIARVAVELKVVIQKSLFSLLYVDSSYAQASMPQQGKGLQCSRHLGAAYSTVPGCQGPDSWSRVILFHWNLCCRGISFPFCQYQLCLQKWIGTLCTLVIPQVLASCGSCLHAVVRVVLSFD